MHLISYLQILSEFLKILLPYFHKDKNSKHILFFSAPDKLILKVLI